MKLIDDIRHFFLRKRAWPFLIGALAVVLVGQYIERHELKFGDLASAGADVTQSIRHKLDQQQPGDMLRRYAEAMYSESSDCAANCGPRNPISFVFTAVTVTPTVAADSWRSGNWFTRLLLAATIGMVLLLMWGALTDKTKDVGERLVEGAFTFILGPVGVALIFWLVLLLLMLVTFIVGEVLSGIVVVIGTFGGLWKIGMLGIETLKRADEIEEKGVPFFKRMLGARAKPPEVPIPPPVAPPQLPPGGVR